jgi:hypothetical protein
MRTYYVSGIAQIEVRARSAGEAVAKAAAIAERRATKALQIDLDNIATQEHAAVGLDQAHTVDTYGGPDE